MTTKKPLILTGVRSNEEPTLANFLGAFMPMVAMQKKYAGAYQINMFVPDLHSFTTPIHHDTLFRSTLKNLKYFVAAGLDLDDPDTFLYRQSFIPAHSELLWILDCFTYTGEMARMTQFKEKSSEHEKSVTMGLYSYPVLMAADILLYGAQWVPVGEDQFQHLEIARDIAIRFNNKFADVFPEGVFAIPENTKKQTAFIDRDSGLRIRSLSAPTKKMSKSSLDEKSKILMSDEPRIAYKKIMAAVTDDKAEIHFDFKTQPGISSLLQILSLLSGTPQEDINAQWVGKTQYGEFKKVVAQTVATFLSNFQERVTAISDERLLQKLHTSEEAMNVAANNTLLRAQQAVGLRERL